jgi:hypothetical protein
MQVPQYSCESWAWWHGPLWHASNPNLRWSLLRSSVPSAVCQATEHEFPAPAFKAGISPRGDRVIDMILGTINPMVHYCRRYRIEWASRVRRHLRASNIRGRISALLAHNIAGARLTRRVPAIRRARLGTMTKISS